LKFDWNTMALYHVNPETGNAGVCKAEKGRCRFGNVDEHYTSEEAARGSYEAKQEAFRKAHIDDLMIYAPAWHGKLPKRLEGQIARKAAELEFEINELKAKVGKGPLSALEPMVYPNRPRGYELVKTSDLPSYEGDEQYLLALTSRQGGGNRECYCDSYDEHEDGCLALNNELMEDHPQFLYYEDDDFDSTYTTHYFSTKFTPYDVASMELGSVYSAEAVQLNSRLLLIKGEDAPPWSILSKDTKALAQYKTLKNSSTHRQRERQEALAELPKLNELLAVIEEERLLTEEELKNFEPLIKRGYDRGSGFQTAYRSYLGGKEGLRVAEARHRQAEQLPEGELREYLLGDRGTGSYRVEEKVGRRKTTVTKTYAKGTLLGKELEEAQRVSTTTTKYLDDALKPIQEKKKITEEKLAKADEHFEKLEKAREKAWLNGWPSAYGDAPTPPDSF
jgi:hypothetical protein